MGSEELKEAIRRLRQPKSKEVDLSPASTFEALLDQRIKEMERTVGELKGRVNGLVFTVVGAIVIQIVLGFIR